MTAYDSAMNERVDSLVTEILKRLEPFMEGDKETFVASARKEAEDLKTESFGSELLRLVRSNISHSSLSLFHFLFTSLSPAFHVSLSRFASLSFSLSLCHHFA